MCQLIYNINIKHKVIIFLAKINRQLHRAMVRACYVGVDFGIGELVFQILRCKEIVNSPPRVTAASIEAI